MKVTDEYTFELVDEFNETVYSTLKDNIYKKVINIRSNR